MQNEIRKEIVLLKYFSDLLSNGITTGVTLDEFNILLNEIVRTTNLGAFNIFKKEKIGSYEFYNIVKKANEINKQSNPWVYNGIEIKEDNNSITALPTYSLIKNMNVPNMLDPVVNALIKNNADRLMNSLKTTPIDLENVPKQVIDISSKIAAYFINDVIERYVDDKIKFGFWPKQCSNVDEYVFKKNVAEYIDERGTAKTFKYAYINAINTVCDLLKSDNSSIMFDREIYFSNNDTNLLAFANYMKIFMPRSLDFLRQYKYFKYEPKSESRSLCILNDNVYKSKYTFVHSIVQNRPDDDCESLVLNEDVKVMEKRIMQTHL